MGEEEFFAVDFFDGVSVDNLDADLVAEVVEEPDVVVADKPFDADAFVGQSGEGAKEADVASGHDGAILKPIVEDVAHEIEGCGLSAD